MKIIKNLKDSYWGMPFAEFIPLVESEGFVKIYSRSFKGDYELPDNFNCYWHPDGILLTAESYGKTLNNASMYYNVKACVPSGSGVWKVVNDQKVYVGDIDIRENFKGKLSGIRAIGTYSTWIDQGFLWLLTYMDSRHGYENYDHDKISSQVIAQFPEYVQVAIKGIE